MNNNFKTIDSQNFPTKTGVYALKFTGNDKVYIGSASSNKSKNKNKGFYVRWNRHVNLLKNNKHHSIALQNAFNKYGIDNLEFIILELCKPEDCIQKEQFYIDYYDSFKNGYNSRPKADSNLGYKQTEKQKNKIKDKYKKIRDSIAPKVIELYNNDFTTREISKKMKISRGVIVKIFKENNIKGKNIAYYKKKEIHQYTLNGDFIKTWDSIRGCAKSLNINPVSIRFVLQNKCKHSKNFFFTLKKMTKKQVKEKIKSIGDWKPRTGKYVNISQLDCNKKHIKTWNDVKEVKVFLKVNNNGPITNAIKNGIKYKGFYWTI